jgi:hypothetical protein
MLERIRVDNTEMFEWWAMPLRMVRKLPLKFNTV